MKALVTGATGFTGGALARELQRRAGTAGAVRAFVREGRDASDLVSLGFEIARGDIRDESAVIKAATGCDIIYHIAAVFRTAGHSDTCYRDINAGGTAHAISAAKRGAARLVHCSTIGVHGHIDAQHIPADENAPFNPGDIYQQTKLEGEMLVHEAIREGLPATIFRPGGIYGPGDLRFLKLFKTINNGAFRMFGSGRILYHLTYIGDLVDGIIRCGERDEALGQTYILAGPRYTTLNELVEEIAKALGVSPPHGMFRRLPMWPLLTAAAACEAVCTPLRINPPLHRRRVDFFRKDRAFSIEKARRELSFDPKVDLEEGLGRTVAWYVQQGHLKSRPGAQGPSPSGRGVGVRARPIEETSRSRQMLAQKGAA